MADALCGPSNPLQTFQKHTTVDRTLQQDRLTSRRSPAEGFRSHGPNVGVLDPEFEAFQSQSGATFRDTHLANPPNQQLYTPPPQQIASISSSGWSTDFQRLHITNPATSAAASRMAPQPSQQSNVGWYQDFMMQQQGQQTQWPQQDQPQYQSQQPHFPSPLMRMQYSGLSQPMYSNNNTVRLDQNNDNAWNSQDVSQQGRISADFEREFEVYDSVVPEIQQERDTLQESNTTELGQDVVIEDLKAQARAMNALSLEDLREQYLADAATRQAEILQEPQTQDFAVIHDVPQHQEQPAVQSQVDDGDQLAHTASELLERVADNNTKKFQESSFLTLMRQLRDREIRVEGDKMVNADGSTPASTIPPNEQDDDNGRDVSMAGALRPLDDSGMTAMLNANTKPTGSRSAGCFFREDMEIQDIL